MKILILGVGNAQVDAIQYCHAKGHEVYGVSYRKEGRGVKFVDTFAQVDICDRDAVTEFARRENVDLIYSVGSDLAMPTIGEVSEKLGLPYFVDSCSAEGLNNKAHARRLFAEKGLNSVPYLVGQTVEEFARWREFPAIIKPVDSQGQRGVFEVNDAEELRNMLPCSRSFSRTKTVIVEQFIEGPEFSCNAFVRNGEVIHCFVSDRLTLSSVPGGIVSAHRLPSRLTPSHARGLTSLVEATVAALPVADGPVYFQTKFLPGETDPTLIEVTPRLDGCHLWRLIDTVYGVDLLDCSFRALMGDALPQTTSEARVSGSYSLEFFHQAPNIIFEGIKDDGGTLYMEPYYVPGEVVRPINERSEKVGYCIRRVPDNTPGKRVSE